ncbi:MAG: glycine--tRNA ligase subunit beta [Candidatus Geothermincolales bacterium]
MAEDLLFEIGTEELPWGAVQDGRKQLRENAIAVFSRERLEYDSLEIYSTPRRLALYVSGLSERQKDEIREIKGPSRAAAFDEQGRPTKAAEGFARSRGVRVEDLQVRNTEKGEFVFAVVREEGKPTLEILPRLLEELLRSFNFRKSMRWGDREFRFARPVRWLVALYGEKVLEFEFEGIRAGNVTRGRRFIGPPTIVLAHPREYLEALRQAGILADQEERREAVREGMERAASAAGLVPVPAPETFDEVVDLVEFPTVTLGEFDRKYLGLPREVLFTAMQEHQRYFPTLTREGQVAPAFLFVHNGDPAFNDVIKAGNERVLKARLEDATFFFQEDGKRSLEERLEDLRHVVWQAKLGTLYDKSHRLSRLAAFIAERAHLDEDTVRRSTRAGLLCKADLVTSMVVEFPSLQGVMGRIYASRGGEDEEVAQAIEEHYLPRWSGDRLPVTRTGAVLSLAEKADNLVGCFSVGLVPSGSEDPYALRRQAAGVMQVVRAAGLHLDLGKVFEKAAELLGLEDPAETLERVREFFLQRFRQSMIAEGHDYDLVDAVLPFVLRDLLDAEGRLLALEQARREGRLQRVYTGFERCYNLSRQGSGSRLDENLLAEEAERELYSRLTWSQDPLHRYLDESDYGKALEVLLELAPHVDRFFAEIFVMGDDERLRENRLALLKEVVSLYLEFADFSRVVTEG